MILSPVRRYWLVAFWLAACAAGLAGCGSVPTPPVEVQVTGNHNCTPSSDLPAHKTMKKVPESDTFMDDLYGLFGIERSSHAADIKDYNSLYDECVRKAPTK